MICVTDRITGPCFSVFPDLLKSNLFPGIVDPVDGPGLFCIENQSFRQIQDQLKTGKIPFYGTVKLEVEDIRFAPGKEPFFYRRIETA